MYAKSEKSRNRVRLNSIVTLRCQTIVDGSKETVYETFKIVDDPETECVYKGVGFNSIIGKILRGGIKDQSVMSQCYDSATIVEILNDDAAGHKVGKDSIIEIELYKDFECTDLIGTKVLGCGDDFRDQFNNKEINSVVKLYHLRSRAEFAKIRRIVSRQEIKPAMS